MASLNIKDPETHKLARRVAKLTGESMTQAVRQSLRERAKRLEQGKSGGLVERLKALSKETAKLIKEPYRSMTHEELDDLLYDEKGLPK